MDTKKTRDALRTRQAILEVAAQKFTEKSYDAIGLREIAEQVGVSVSLVNRYFGSKENLFVESVTPSLTLEPYLQGDVESYAQVIILNMLSKSRQEEGFDPLVAVIRSISSEPIKPAIKEAFENRVLATLSEKLSGEDASQRAALIVSLLFGFDALRRIVEVDALSNDHKESVSRLFSKTLQDLISP